MTNGPGVFLSYRRKEPGHAGRLHDRLVEDLGEDRVFMDVDSIRPGEDWIEAISRALAKCAVMLVLIGDQWGQVRSERAAHGDSDDPVLFEIDAAFDQGIRIIPVLLDDAVMPRHADLPNTLLKLSHLQAMRVRHDTFKSDAARLLTVVHEILDAYEKAGSSAPSKVGNILGPDARRNDPSSPADQVQAPGEAGTSRTTAGQSEGLALEARPRLSPARRLLIPLLTLVSLVAVGFGTWTITTTTRTDQAAAQEIAEPIGTAVDAFLEGVGQDVPQTRPPNAGGSVTGNTEGLYGGTRRGTSCDTAKLVAFLQTHPDEGAAWAGVLKLTVQQIPSFVSELTPLILRADTRVTNHGFKDGKVTSFPSILQAGTAVLVDKQGVPVVKCYCGNPLTPPRQVTRRYQGNAWPGFDAQKVIVVKPAPTAIESFTVVDQTTGKKLSKETGASVPKEPDQTDGTANPTSTETPATDDTPSPALTETAKSDDTASPTSTETPTTDDTASSTPTETPSPEDTATESESVSPPESDTADPATGGDSQDAGDFRESGQGTDGGQEGGDSQGSGEGSGSGETQAGTDSGGGSDNQQDTGTNGGAAGTNPDTGGGANPSPGQ